MKVLHVVQGYYPGLGGTEKLIQGISESLVEHFSDTVTVFTTNCYGGEAFARPEMPRMPAGWGEINGVRVRRFPVWTKPTRLFERLQSYMYRNGLIFNDYVRTWSHGPWIPALGPAILTSNAEVISAASFPLMHMYDAHRAARLSGRPIVLTGALHPDDDWGYNRAIIHQAIRTADAYVALTEYEAEYVRRMGVDPNRVFVAGGGVNPDLYGSISCDEARQKLGLREGPLIGYIGQITLHKLDLLMKAMPKIWEQMPQVQLLMAGSKTTYHDQLHGIMASWPEAWRQNVTLRYNFAEEEKPALFAAIDVLAYTSFWESFGIAYVEAWAAGKPVVGCMRGAVPWLVEAGRDGLLVRYTDESMLAEALLFLLRRPDIARSMGEAGREKTLRRYTWEQIGRRYREIYERALQRSRRA